MAICDEFEAIWGRTRQFETICDESEAIRKRRVQFESIYDEIGPICDEFWITWDINDD